MIYKESVRLSSRGQLVIPKAIRDAMGLIEGTELIAIQDEERIILIRPADYAKSSRGALKGVWGASREEIDRAIERERDSWD